MIFTKMSDVDYCTKHKQKMDGKLVAMRRNPMMKYQRLQQGLKK